MGTTQTKRKTLPPPAAKAHTASRAVSLPWMKFLYRNARDPLLLWRSQVLHTYAERWVRRDLLPNAGPHVQLSQLEPTKTPSFVRASATPTELLEHLAGIERRLRLDTLVRLVTSFEAYLFDVIRRAIFLDPHLLKDSQLQFTAGEIVASNSIDTNMRDWLGRTVADRWIRGGDHEEKIKKVARLVKASVTTTMSAQVEQWSLWVLVRNSVTHLDGDVSDELSAKWSARFGKSTAPIELTDDDVIQVAKLSREIAAAVDQRFVSEVVHLHDARLLERECFLRWGVDDAGVLSSVASVVLATKFRRAEASKHLAKLKNVSSNREATYEQGFTFSAELLHEVEKRVHAEWKPAEHRVGD